MVSTVIFHREKSYSIYLNLIFPQLLRFDTNKVLIIIITSNINQVHTYICFMQFISVEKHSLLNIHLPDFLSLQILNYSWL